MIRVGEFFRSVEHIWVLWVLSTAILAWMLQRALAGITRFDWKVLWKREEGAAYSLSYVMTFPIFMLVLALVVETTLFLVVKIGSVYAAAAGARAQIVWRSLDPAKAQERTRQAVVHGMAAVASSSNVHARGAGISGPPSAKAERYFEAYKKYSKGNATKSYVTAKYRYAEKATTLEVNPSNPRWNDDITVKVHYEMPFHLPVIGRILGRRAPWSGARFYTYRISSEATLRNQGPRNDEQKLGIDYVSP